MMESRKLAEKLIRPLILAALVFSANAPAAAGALCTDHLPGIEYSFRVFHEPRPVRAHVLEVDLSEGRAEPVVVIADDSAVSGRNAVRTDPRKLAAHPSIMVFVNTNPWSPWGPEYPVNVKITGLAATAGAVRSSPDEKRVSVWTDKDGLLKIGSPEITDIREGAGGFAKILKGAQAAVGKGGQAHPRTAIGVNERGDKLWLAVVEGRNPGVSEGMTTDELAVLMSGLGCWDAANMDGGGSSIMGIVDKNGNLRIFKGTPEEYVRPLPVILAIRRRQVE